MITAPGISSVYDIRGLSTDTKPTENICNGTTFFEIDTSKLFIYDEENNIWRELTRKFMHWPLKSFNV